MKNLNTYKLVLYIICIVTLLFVFTVGEAFAQGPVYNNPYNGGYKGYLYDSGYGYQSAWSDARVVGRHYYRQYYTYVQQETSFTPNATYGWVAGQGDW